MVQFLTFVITNIFSHAPRFPLMLTAKFYFLYVKESGVGNFGNVGVVNFGQSESEIFEGSE